ncbi:MAG: methylmalonyl-CoA epimerase [Alicyclobacillus sp.]|nr:methylmalonyl-CoA epimerase [Alicyclobacillus sp.]
MTQPIRVLVAKPGLDGHDRGALVIAQGLRDQGMEVIYTGLRQTPEQIANTAVQEDVACVGLSSLSGAHLELFPEVVRQLRARGAEDILVVGGGVIPDEDIPALQAAGIAHVFTPGTRIEDVAAFIRAHVHNHLPAEHAVPGVLQIDHIGIAVHSLASALPMYTQLLGLTVYHEEVIADQQVRTAFLRVGETDLELLEPTDGSGPIAQFLQRRGPGIHHIAYAVADIEASLRAARAAGYRLIDEAPRPGGHGKQIAFLHPKDTGGVLVEFCQRGVGAAEEGAVE